LIKALPEIIAQSVKPIENIEGIKILQLDGLTNGIAGATTSVGENASSGGIADQAVTAALRYRSQAPLVDGLLKELGIEGGSLDGLAQPIKIPDALPLSVDTFQSSESSIPVSDKD
jgi:uncharacterized membrane protein YqiK